MSKQIESMTIEEVVKKYIQPFVVQKYLKSSINRQELAEVEKYRKLAGFIESVSDARDQLLRQKANGVLHEAMEKLNLNIIIKRPPFLNHGITDEETHHAFWNLAHCPDIIRISDKTEVIVKQTKLFGKTFTKTATLREPQFLIEVEPEEYVGKVPESAIIATGKAVEADLHPKVWVAGTYSELANSVRKQVDPLIVGYPCVSSKEYYTDHCLLIAAWGKDLEIIDQYFSSFNSIKTEGEQ